VRRQDAKPYDHQDEANSDSDSDPENIFNPSGAGNNCVHLGFGYASGLPNDRSPPPACRASLTLHEIRDIAEQEGFEILDSPPEEDYTSGNREVAADYLREDGSGHVVAKENPYATGNTRVDRKIEWIV